MEGGIVLERATRRAKRTKQSTAQIDRTAARLVRSITKTGKKVAELEARLQDLETNFDAKLTAAIARAVNGALEKGK